MEQTTAKKFKGDKREGREKNEALRMLRALYYTRVSPGENTGMCRPNRKMVTQNQMKLPAN